jgi:hypothetical protein
LHLVTFFLSLKGHYCQFFPINGTISISNLSSLRSRAAIPLVALVIISLVLNGIITNVPVKAQLEASQLEVFPLSPNANVRQGEIWGAESGSDRLVVLRTGD